MRVVVVCGAGASSTFVAAKLRTAATARGLELAASPASVETLGPLTGVDVVLVGAHLASGLDPLRERAAASGAVVALLPATSPAAMSGEAVLELALDALGSRTAGTDPDPTDLATDATP